jgi:hypothetical protein
MERLIDPFDGTHPVPAITTGINSVGKCRKKRIAKRKIAGKLHACKEKRERERRARIFP